MGVIQASRKGKRCIPIMMEKTKMMPGRIMVLLVVLGAFISFFGWYEPFAEFAGAGASVPLLGFGNLLMKGNIGGHRQRWIYGIIIIAGKNSLCNRNFLSGSE